MAITAVTVALTTSALHHWTRSSLSVFITASFSVMSTICSQTQNFPIGAKASRKVGEWDKAVYKKIILVWSIWLLVVALITNNYGAAFSSNYVTEPVYSRNWSTNLLKMENFTFFIGFDEPPLEVELEDLEDEYYICSNPLSRSTAGNSATRFYSWIGVALG